MDSEAGRQTSSNDGCEKVDDPEQNHERCNHPDKVQPKRGFGVLV